MNGRAFDWEGYEKPGERKGTRHKDEPNGGILSQRKMAAELNTVPHVIGDAMTILRYAPKEASSAGIPGTTSPSIGESD